MLFCRRLLQRHFGSSSAFMYCFQVRYRVALRRRWLLLLKSQLLSLAAPQHGNSLHS